MAELADAIDLGSIVNRRAGSTPVIRTKKESEGLYDLRFLFRTHSVLEPAGSRSPLRFGRRKADVPGHRAVSASLRSAQSRGPPDLVRSLLRSGRRKADVPGPRAVSASLRSAQSRGPPDLVRPVIRSV